MFFVLYHRSEVVPHDAVVVHIADKYYLNGNAYWSDSVYLKRIADRIEQMRPTLIGNIAPPLNMQTVEGNFAALDTIKARYTIVCFYAPSCGHCQKEVPELWKIYQNLRQYGIKVYAVYTEYDRAEWEKFVRTDHHFDWIDVWDGFDGQDEKGGATTFSLGSRFRELYDIYSTPTLFLLDANKRILTKRIGVEQLENLLQELLKRNDR
jgi:thiol-disulfide isomerase/thioredoxin